MQVERSGGRLEALSERRKPIYSIASPQCYGEFSEVLHSLGGVERLSAKEPKEKEPLSPARVLFLSCSMLLAGVVLLSVLGSFLVMVSWHFRGLPELLAGILSFGLGGIFVVFLLLFIRRRRVSRRMCLVGSIGVLVLGVIIPFCTGSNVSLVFVMVVVLFVGSLFIQMLVRFGR